MFKQSYQYYYVFFELTSCEKDSYGFQEHAAIRHVSSTGLLAVPAVANDAVERLRVGLEGVAHRSAETATGQCFGHGFFFEYFVVSREKTGIANVLLKILYAKQDMGWRPRLDRELCAAWSSVHVSHWLNCLAGCIARTGGACQQW